VDTPSGPSYQPVLQQTRDKLKAVEQQEQHRADQTAAHPE
jgi:hypothetical protein